MSPRLKKSVNYGVAAADTITAWIGSWRFLRQQNIFIALWMGWNTFGPILLRFDPPPFIGLNLLMSWEAANSSSITMVSSNRHEEMLQTQRDRMEALEQRILSLEEQMNSKLDRLLARDSKGEG